MLLFNVLATSCCVPFAMANFLTGTYAPPQDFSSNSSLIRQGFTKASDVFNAYLLHNSTNGTSGIAGIEGVTFSLSMFSLKGGDAPALQYHYTAPEIQQSVNGTRKVDADSIYRGASIMKLVTVLTGLLELNKAAWDTPVSELVPAFNSGPRTTYSPRWDQITPRHLASHQAGLQRTGPIADLFTAAIGQAQVLNKTVDQQAIAAGLPLFNTSTYGGCFSLGCSREEFINSSKWNPSAFLPATNPSYSNYGMMVLGLVISEITGKPYDQLYRERLFSRVGMNSSFTDAPLSGQAFDRAVVAGPFELSGYSIPKNDPSVPSGGLLTSINDLNKLGIAILNSTLMDPIETREWMKPLSHTSSLSYSIGAPWEITRYVHNTTGKVTDIYAKLGDSGFYGGMLAFIPEYEAGFSFLNAYSGDTRTDSALKILNHLVINMLPAFEAQAAAETRQAYTGTYSNPSTNSSLTIAFNQSDVSYPKDALTLTTWQSRGVDMVQSQFRGQKRRLLPSILEDEKRPVFQLTGNSQYPSYEAGGFGPFTGFYDSNFDFPAYEGERYFGGSVSTFEFEVGEDGKVASVRDGATRDVLKRVE